MKKYLKLIIIALMLAPIVGSAQMHTLNKDLPCVNKIYQIHAHVFLDSMGIANYTPDMLRDDLAGASEAFSPICIGFELCGVDTIYNYEFDSIGTDIEDREIKNLFQVPNRINMYLASELQAPPICGYAGGEEVVLKCPGGTVIHELGHVFGLAHTFAGGDELADGSNCATAGDGFCDTPADPYTDDPTIQWQDGCEFIWEGLDPNGQFYNPDVGNIMSYYSCSCGFSREQFLRMAEVSINGFSRTW